MAIFQGVLILIFGIGLLLMDYRALGTGLLPCGPNGIKGRLEFKKDGQPVAFWLMFGVYMVGGLALTIYAALLLAGRADPLPLR